MWIFIWFQGHSFNRYNFLTMTFTHKEITQSSSPNICNNVCLFVCYRFTIELESFKDGMNGYPAVTTNESSSSSPSSSDAGSSRIGSGSLGRIITYFAKSTKWNESIYFVMHFWKEYVSDDEDDIIRPVPLEPIIKLATNSPFFLA